MNRVETRIRVFVAGVAVAVLLFVANIAPAAHQTETLSPVTIGGLPYQISVEPYDFGPADLPTLHSYAAAHYDGKWVLIAGKTNGVHTFNPTGPNGFTPETQNREVWVIDPAAKQSWHRSLEGAAGGLTTAELYSLTPANNQFYQDGDRLYMVGGYGVQSIQANGTPINGTFNQLSAIDLPGMIQWVTSGNGVAKDHIRQYANETLRVTGGAMYKIGTRTHLVFGQNFSGNYNPNKNGTYTNQVRSFDIVDDGMNLSIANITTSDTNDAYRRRDLNVFPVLRLGAGSELEKGIVVLSGVFTETFGAWTVPVEIDASGTPTMADPNLPGTFKQGYNGYHSAKLGMYSEGSQSMHEVLFGGISLQTMNTQTMQTETDNDLPFINDITSVVIDAAGNYNQHWLGQFPAIHDGQGQRWRFGANAEFFLAEGIPTFDNGVIKLNALTGPTVLGYIFGGITANGPHTRSGNPPAISTASDRIFTVIYTPVPEPATGFAALIIVLPIAIGHRPRCRK